MRCVIRPRTNTCAVALACRGVMHQHQRKPQRLQEVARAWKRRGWSIVKRGSTTIQMQTCVRRLAVLYAMYNCLRFSQGVCLRKEAPLDERLSARARAYASTHKMLSTCHVRGCLQARTVESWSNSGADDDVRLRMPPSLRPVSSFALLLRLPACFSAHAT